MQSCAVAASASLRARTHSNTITRILNVPAHAHVRHTMGGAPRYWKRTNVPARVLLLLYSTLCALPCNPPRRERVDACFPNAAVAAPFRRTRTHARFRSRKLQITYTRALHGSTLLRCVAMCLYKRRIRPLARIAFSDRQRQRVFQY